ncbi:hypothetical protein [Chitinophaga arvensicola]|uniref:Repeat domain-containing protein n=1 Tax=Chitinophaga arvensicola TaxID=29529 RepID=A0A1I0S6G5_9BACT|nr:hypothetical protein [Chitinophaga arvensicola]SEW51047.1 hypothetical protein SAMN04488122_4092 [Chitinophaga arvensicola]
MKKIVPVLFFAFFIACQERVEKTTDTSKTDTTLPVAVAVPPVAENEEAARYPGDSGYAGSILTTGEFHDDEVKESDAKKNWIGIFSNDTGYYLAPANVKLKRVNDAVVDEEGQMTGWEVKTDHKDSVVLLIAGLDLLREGPLTRIALSKDQLQPGDSLPFRFSGVNYVLHASGNRVKRDGDYQVEDYKLFLSVEKDGHRTTELLAAQPNFDDNMIRILFAGDIDGDGKPDLLLDGSWHYNVTAPTLYLSKPAEAGHLLKVTARHTAVGC